LVFSRKNKFTPFHDEKARWLRGVCPAIESKKTSGNAKLLTDLDKVWVLQDVALASKMVM